MSKEDLEAFKRMRVLDRPIFKNLKKKKKKKKHGTSPYIVFLQAKLHEIWADLRPVNLSKKKVGFSFASLVKSPASTFL